MNEENNFWYDLTKVLGIGIEGYKAHKTTTWIDTIISYIPFILFLVFLYIMFKRK